MSQPCRITEGDPRWYEGARSTIELVSQSYNLDRAGVGSSPYQGDLGNTGVAVPAAPTTDHSSVFRYMFILAGVEIPGGCGVVVRGLRQAIILRAVRNVGTLAAPLYRVFELQQTSPFWSFQDGNVSWHLRWRPNQMSPRGNRVPGDGSTPGMTQNLLGLDAALVYRNLAPYRPPASGLPPGPAVNNLGTFYDLRFSWEPNNYLEIPLRGPGVVELFASVMQTDPDTRVPTPACLTTQVLSPEDQFIAAFPEAVYGRVAGGMTVDMLPGGCERMTYDGNR